MSLISLIAALLLEQLRPLASRKTLVAWLDSYASFFNSQLNAGKKNHGMLAWLLAVLIPLCVTVFFYRMLYHVQPLIAWAFNVLVLYLTMGFRQFSHYYTDIHQALRDNNLEKARSLLATWRGLSCH